MNLRNFRNPRGLARAVHARSPQGSSRPVRSLVSGTTLALALLAAPASLAAQSAPPGYGVTTTQLTGQDQLLVTLTEGPFQGEQVRFDGSVLTRETGTQSITLLTLPGPLFASFAVQVDTGHVIFGESTTNDLWLVPLLPSPSNPPGAVTNIFFNYDAVLWDPNTLLVSAKTDNFSGPDNDLLAMDLSTWAVTTVARLPGASGPIALTPAGDLLYATVSLAFPAPPASTDVLRLDRTAIQNALAAGTVLGPASATVVVPGLPGASSLEVDAQGDIFLTDPVNQQLVEFPRLGSGTPVVWSDLSTAGLFPGGLQFIPGTTGAFAPYQPAVGGTLLVFETDFFSTTRQQRFTPRRPGLVASATSLPAGPQSLSVTAGPRAGFAQIWIGAGGPAVETPLSGLGFGVPLLVSPTVLSPVFLGVVSLDLGGGGSLQVSNPGGFPMALPVTCQAIAIGADGTGMLRAGTSAPLAVTLLP